MMHGREGQFQINLLVKPPQNGVTDEFNYKRDGQPESEDGEGRGVPQAYLGVFQLKLGDLSFGEVREENSQKGSRAANNQR